MKLSKTYWSERYITQNVPWDTGVITTPIKEYIDRLTDKNLKILIPGVGNGHELTYLHNRGFTNVYGLDISEEPLQNFKTNNPLFPKENLIEKDFFDFEDSFDLIIEQTFFCALLPDLRTLYAKKMFDLLKPNGKLAGVLFSYPLTAQGPPFGGSKIEYQKLFQEFFTIQTLEPCYNSIKPRKNNEYFIILKKES